MQEFGLGPNGGMIYCLEYLEENFDWLQESLEKLHGEDGQPAEYIVFDMPGQVELSTNHDSLRNIVRKLEKLGYRLAAINLTDAFHVTDASKYVAILLLSLRTMLQLELPHINVLSKIDLVTSYGDLPFNLDFYTEVQDLSYLQYELEKDPRSGKFSELNKAICDIVEDFGLVGFQTLCVEDKMSMAGLVKSIDQMLGCVPKTTHSHSHSAQPRSQQPEQQAETAHQLLHSLPPSFFPSTLDIQEKYVDRSKEYTEHERDKWKMEGEELMRKASEMEQKRAIEKGRMANEKAGNAV